MEFLLIPVVFAIGAGLVAKGKNRNVVLWVLISLVIGPFALLILGIIKPGPGPNQIYQ